MPPPPEAVHRYHDGTKHHFHSFARSLGYLDWASQPHPFRAFDGAPAFPLHPSPGSFSADYLPRGATYDEMFEPTSTPSGLTVAAVGDVLRHALGLSAWKQFRESRWSLRVNPSSGNLHPTEAYVLSGPAHGLAGTPAVYHYAADRHLLELRCAFDGQAWAAASGGDDLVLVALTSIHWRESWKYGERAFRYCQHDVGHAIAAAALAAAIVGWRAVMLPAWSQEAIAAITGTDRDEDFVEAEREEPACVIALVPDRLPEPAARADAALVAAVRAGRWTGRASRLSDDHVEWTFIDQVARATRDPGRSLPPVPALPFFTGAGAPPPARTDADASARISMSSPWHGRRRSPPALPALPALDARAIVLQRRSALAFDGVSSVGRDRFFAMLSRVMPRPGAPWDALWWTPRIHLGLFVHRVDDVPPGLYVLVREPDAVEALRASFGREFLWERAHDVLPLMCLARGDCRSLARRLSCDQDIAADGFFSLGMIAEFDASLEEHGPSFYRHLFWESGVVGQVLYLEAEAAGARSTGIGCFYDDPVHDVFGLTGHAFQSLYHFTVGMPLEDTRLTTASGYAWERVR